MACSSRDEPSGLSILPAMFAARSSFRTIKPSVISKAADGLSFERHYSTFHLCHRRELGDLSAKTLLTQVITQAILKEGSVLKPWSSHPLISVPCVYIYMCLESLPGGDPEKDLEAGLQAAAEADDCPGSAT